MVARGILSIVERGASLVAWPRVTYHGCRGGVAEVGTGPLWAFLLGTLAHERAASAVGGSKSACYRLKVLMGTPTYCLWSRFPLCPGNRCGYHDGSFLWKSVQPPVRRRLDVLPG